MSVSQPCQGHMVAQNMPLVILIGIENNSNGVIQLTSEKPM